MRKGKAGFTLIEIIVTLALVGVLTVFAGLFLTAFVNSYSLVKDNSDTALKAQIALDRISLELREATTVSLLTDNALITYTNPWGADRTIKHVGSNLYLSTSADYLLLDRVQSFQLSATYGNVYGIAANDMAFIDIGFTVSGYPALSTRIFPRTRIPHP
jgi:prepilin-type N-terminal cleavage/methylation domain-containing protein